MKIIKAILRTIGAFLRTIYRFFDKHLITPITKFILLISDKLGKRTDRLEKILVRNNSLIIISLFVAISIFLYVDNESTLIVNESAEVLYDQKVEVKYNTNAYVIEGIPDTVDVTLIGRRDVLYLAKQLSTGSVSANLSNLKVGTHTIKLNYNNPITSIDYKLDPSIINVTIYPKVSETRTASIDVINKNKLNSKLSVGDVELSQSEVVIKGAEHTLSKVSTVKALVDASKIVDPNIGTASLDDIKLVAYDSEGEIVKGVEMEPSKLSATLKIESPKKELPIKVVPTGNVEFGKAIDNISIDVSKVVVYGDRDVLEKLDYLETSLDVTGLATDKEYNVILSKPAGVKELSLNNIKVKISLAAEVTKEVNNVTIATTNLDSNYKAVAIGENSSKTVVVVKGTKNVIDSIDENNIIAEVDLSGYGEGDYEVNVVVKGEDCRAIYVPKTTKIKVRISKK